MIKPPYPQTPKQARAWFPANGISITEWCHAFQVDRYIATDLLRERLKGSRGESHRVAILLGLKADPTPPEAPAAERRTDNDRRRAARPIDRRAA